MSGEKQDALDKIYDELKQIHDQIALKVHLGGMELRKKWNELDTEWETWIEQVKADLEAKGDDLETRLREAGGEDLRKVEIKTKLAISKLEKGFKEVAEKLNKE